MANQAVKDNQPRLKASYRNDFVKQLGDELKLRNLHDAPKLEKIVINIKQPAHARALLEKMGLPFEKRGDR
jgi:hypothetical protein